MAPPTRLHLPLAVPYRAATAFLLPERLRSPFDLSIQRAEQAGVATAIRALQMSYRAMPRRLRHVPAYVEATRRIRGKPAVDRIGRAIERTLLRAVG